MADRATGGEARRDVPMWNYVDILALALAEADSLYFEADSTKWHQVVLELKKQTKDRYPYLFDGVVFDLRRPTNPYSAQVDSFFRVMARSGELSLLNPAYKFYELKPETKVTIRSQRQALLDRYGEVIQEMARLIHERLSVPKERVAELAPGALV